MSGSGDEGVMRALLERSPGFRSRWEAHQEYWEGEEAGLCLDLAEYAAYVDELLGEEGAGEELDGIFRHVEAVLAEGPDDVRDAVATCFLENLVNGIVPGSEAAAALVSRLGPRSLEYCRAWDEFSGGGIPELDGS